MSLRAASCFSGIGAPELGGPQFEWLWHAEVEKFPSAVMATRFPDSTNLGDVTADDFLQRASAFGRLDLLVGGPPCQDFSVAGLRAGVAGDRGNLSLRFMEIAHAIRPRNLLVENVPGWLNMPDNAFGCFLGALVGADDALCSPLDGKWPSAGMVAGPRARAAWRVFDAQYFGVAQRRRRVFVVADFGEGADPAAVLFERKGVSGNSPPRRETGQGTAGTISARTQGGGGLGTDFELGGGLVQWPAEIAGTLNTHLGDKQGLEDQHINGGCGHFIARSLRGEGFDASEDGTGRGTPIVPVAFSSKDYGNDATDDLSPTLRSMGHDKSHANGGGQMAVAQPVAFMENQQGAVWEADVFQALNRGGGKPGQSYPAVREGWQVRRLTPTECHRLQGFPDDHCAIQHRGKIAADGPQYKALGNSWAVPNGAWIIGRIAERLAA